MQFTGGRVPQSVINILNTPPTEETARSFSETLNAIQKEHPSVAAKVSDENKDIARIMADEVELGSKTSFADARKIRQQRLDNLASAKTFDDSLLPKDSRYKTLADIASEFGSDFPVSVAEDYRAAYRRQQHLTPHMNDEELSKRALAQITWAKEDIAGKQFTMFNAPSKIYKDPEDLKAFKVITEQYVKDNNIGNFQLIPGARSVDGKTGYLLFNWDKNQFEDKVFSPNKEEAYRIMNPNRGAEFSLGNVIGKIETGIRNPNLISEIQAAQAKVPALADEKGLFTAIAKTESNFNTSAVNPDSKAYGLYQFVESTGKQYGLAPGGSVEDQHSAMISYWRDLTRRYPGDTERALKEYSGYFYNKDKYGEKYANEEFNRYMNTLKKNGYKPA
ncbi:transglycosylase SLT domain-containing protein [Methylomonas koyamae]|nr:transglycosylase SLT domain-containing protein [Methylomonas koyamae]BBL57008.1 hypothetical protein MKFW12EY_06210 [Methylomonas koyamae]